MPSEIWMEVTSSLLYPVSARFYKIYFDGFFYNFRTADTMQEHHYHLVIIPFIQLVYFMVDHTKKSRRKRSRYGPKFFQLHFNKVCKSKCTTDF